MAAYGCGVSGAGLPEGTVTFLLTDVEGSTRLWDEHPSGMAAALARHDSLVTEAVAAHSGHLLKMRGEGDSTFSVFAQPSDALAAVVELQLAVAREEWPDGLELPVRAAIHTGEAELRDGDYFGGTVNRAARLRSLGHGGQILLSEATAELAASALPSGASLRDLGVFELKGLTRPERVHQLCHTDLPSEFAPLVGDARRDTNLPAQLTEFIGRQNEQNELRKLLEERRMVTVTGPGGSGKTRLSIEVAADWVDRVRDGVWLVELASVADPALVAGSIASAIGVREQPGQPLLDTIVAEARGREQLLVVDNCEHLVDACAEVLETLLRECPDLRVLASSRQPVGVRGEDTFPLPPLGLPPESEDVTAQSVNDYDATRLFLERASLTHAELQPEDAGAVATICRRLDGIPLAIELAAARTSVLTPAQIATRLDDRFQLLESTARTVEPRQRTLRGAIDWSHELLDDAERALFRRLSVFAGPATLDAVEDVCGEGIDVLDALSHLVDKSLVIHERGRYRMLETIRAYARSQLRQSADLTPTNQRFFDWARTLITSRSPEELDLEIDNLRAALAWAIDDGGDRDAGISFALAHTDFWRARGHWTEAFDRLSGAVALERLSDSVRSRCAAQASNFAILRGDHGGARELAERAIELATNDDETARGRLAAATALHMAGDTGAAIEQWESVAESARQSGSPLLVPVLGNLGVAAHSMGRTIQARAYYEEALAESPAEEYAEILTVNLGNVLIDLGDYDSAHELLERGLAIARKRGDLRATAEALRNLGKVATARGFASVAVERLSEAVDMCRELGDAQMLSAALINVAEVGLAAGEFDDARAAAAESLEVVGSSNPRMIGARKLVLADIDVARGALDDAEGELAAGLAVARDTDWFSLRVEALRVAAMFALGRRRFEVAARLFAAYEALRGSREGVSLPNEKARVEAAIATLREEADPDQLAADWAQGTTMSVDEALDLAARA